MDDRFALESVHNGFMRTLEHLSARKKIYRTNSNKTCAENFWLSTQLTYIVAIF